MSESVVLDIPVVKVMQQLLIELGVGTAPADSGSWPIYLSSEPDQPDNVITIYCTEPQGDGRLFPSGERQDHYGIQFRIRSAASSTLSSYEVGSAKAHALAKALDQDVISPATATGSNPFGKANEVTISGTHFITYSMTRRGGVLFLGRSEDNRQRDVFTVNYLATVAQMS